MKLLMFPVVLRILWRLQVFLIIKHILGKHNALSTAIFALFIVFRNICRFYFKHITAYSYHAKLTGAYNEINEFLFNSIAEHELFSWGRGDNGKHLSYII